MQRRDLREKGLINVGKILKPQGIRGEVKILPITDNVARFKSLKYLIVKGQAKPVLSLRITGDYIYAKLAGVEDRNSAELLRDEYVAVERKDAIKLPEDKHFIVDLLGCDIVTGAKKIGKLVDVLQNTRTDVYVVKREKDEIMFPIVPGLIINTDTENGVIEVDEKILSEITVYED